MSYLTQFFSEQSFPIIIVALVLIFIYLIIVKLKNEFKKLTCVIVYGLARPYRYIVMMSHTDRSNRKKVHYITIVCQ